MQVVFIGLVKVEAPYVVYKYAVHIDNFVGGGINCYFCTPTWGACHKPCMVGLATSLSPRFKEIECSVAAQLSPCYG